eukprot:jgi/Botrbrau1/19426/Bobra.0338s0052.2
MDIPNLSTAAEIVVKKKKNVRNLEQDDKHSEANLASLCVIDLAAARHQALGNCTALYNSHDPLHIVEGEGCWLIDHDGKKYLDCVNNVAHVGHSNPRVTQAVQKQIALLNTNIRYLNAGIPELARLLTLHMGPSLRTEDGAKLYLTTSGSEANDLALRIAWQWAQSEGHPGSHHVAVMNGAYHGHTLATLALSPYKFDGPGGLGKPHWVHVMPCPDVCRGTDLDGEASARKVIAEARECGGRIVAFFCESIISCGGQVVLPEGYLQMAYKVFREEGAICIADEVQCGFGRVGTDFWAYRTAHVMPDVVTLAKSMGNGVPMGGVVVRPDIAAVFDNQGMEYFATCGGCNLAVAAGLAVLEELYDDNCKLVVHADIIGQTLLENLKHLEEEYDFVAQARGVGLMIGIEFWDGAETKRHASAVTKWVQQQMLKRRILLSVDGPFNSVIKIKPPIVMDKNEISMLSAELDLVCQKVPSFLCTIPGRLAELSTDLQTACEMSELQRLEDIARDLSEKVRSELGGATDPSCAALLAEMEKTRIRKVAGAAVKDLQQDLRIDGVPLHGELAQELSVSGSESSASTPLQISRGIVGPGPAHESLHRASHTSDAGAQRSVESTAHGGQGPASHPLVLPPTAATDEGGPDPFCRPETASTEQAGTPQFGSRLKRKFLVRQPVRFIRGLMNLLRLRL